MSLKEIARISGASVATVSRVLSRPGYTCRDKALQERIWDAAEKLEYVPNHAAQQLKAKNLPRVRSRRVDVFLTRFQTLDEDIFFRELYEVLREILFRQNCIVRRLLTLPEMISRAKNISWEHFQEKMPDGLIMLGKCPPELLPFLKKQYQNLVGIDRNPTSFDYDEVFCDGSLAAEMAMDYLISLGHRRIAYIGDCSYEARYIGYHQSLMAHKLSLDYSYVYPTSQTRQEGQQMMNLILGKEDRPTAVFCANDSTALGVFDALKAHRKKGYIPSVISIDNIHEAETCAPMLTTINIPRREMAHHAVSLLLDRMDGGHRETVRIEMQGRLVVRDSCGYCAE